ncbi:MAG: glycosyltransferase family 4 protein [Promethearchaeota archaeon]
MKHPKKYGKHNGQSVFIVASPPTLELPATDNVWQAMRCIFETVFLLVQQDSKWNIIMAKNNSTNSISKIMGFSSSKKKLMMEFLAIKALLKLRKHVDVILLYQCTYSPLISLLARLMRKKVVVFLGGSRWDVLKANISYAPSSNFYHVIQQLLFDICLNLLTLIFCHKIILVSFTTLHDQIVSKFKYKTSLAHNMPSEDIFDKFPDSIDISKRDRVVGYVGAARIIKGIHLLMRAIPLIMSKRSDIKFLIISDYTHCEPSTLFGELKKSLEWQNTQVVKHVKNKDLAKYLNNMKLLVIPSLSEGLPAVALEAMACKTPVLASPVGDLPAIIKDKVSGYLLSNNTPESISKSILRLIDNDDELVNVSNNAYSNLRRNFDFHKMVDMWKKVLFETPR